MPNLKLFNAPKRRINEVEIQRTTQAIVALIQEAARELNISASDVRAMICAIHTQLSEGHGIEMPVRIQ